MRTTDPLNAARSLGQPGKRAPMRRLAQLTRRGLRGAPGFTLIELLTVIGIIGILITIVVLGLNKLRNNAVRNQTLATLQTLSSMVAELDRTGGILRLEGPNDYQPTPVYAQIPAVLPAVGFIKSTLASPGDVSVGAANANGLAVVQTQRILSRLLTLPANKTAYQALPAKSSRPLLFKNGIPYLPGDHVAVATNYYLCLAATTSSPTLSPLSWRAESTTVMIPVDGWGEPILFVPSGGLTGARSSATTVTSVTSPDNRPFWASAGVDGNFGTTTGGSAFADDNMYSFEK